MAATKKRPAQAAARAKAPRARSAVRPGARGPAPLVLSGYTWTPPKGDEPGTGDWTPKSPGGLLLAALSIGATWEHAAAYARLHPSTARAWNSRGAEALADHPNLDAYAATDPDPELLAYAAFHVSASASRSTPVVGALDTIDRARRGGNVSAALAQLKHLPTAVDYRETSRTEVTGEEGGPVRVTADATEQMLDLVRQFAEHPPSDPEEPSS